VAPLSAPGSIDQAFAKLVSPVVRAPAAPSHAAAAASDREAVLSTFEELAVGHSVQVRSLMLEVRWGEAPTSWIAQARPALKSLRAMAGQIEHDALTTALDGFDAALGELLRPGAAPVIGQGARDALLAAYAPLMAAMPRAFELDGERDRREPMVVRALLGQVPGLDPLMIDRMTAAGLGRLEALLGAEADEIAAVAGIATEVAAAVVQQVQAFRRATPTALATPDPAATAFELRALFEELDAQHRGFEDAARGWSVADRDAKKRLRRDREISFLQITIALARLGEVDLALRLEKVPFAQRIAELERRVNRAPSPGVPVPEYDDIEILRIESGAHAAP
jgi:hypothetical protein